MKIFAAILFIIAGAVYASSGLSLNSVEKHMVTPLIDYQLKLALTLLDLLMARQ